MGQVLHGSATTTEAVRQATQHSQNGLRVLAKRYGINQKTVSKKPSSSPPPGIRSCLSMTAFMHFRQPSRTLRDGIEIQSDGSYGRTN
jgi:hypothetical protein